MNETIQYYKTERLGEPFNFRLVTNNYSMSGNNFASKRYMKLYAYFPYMFNRDIRDVLQISYGVGSTAEAVLSLNSVEHFDVVDISKDILDMSTIIHSATGKFPLKDKRTKVHIEDGRFFLQTTQRKYDLITGEPPPPKVAGVVNLYTHEYFELIKKRLKSKGMVTYWLPVHDLNALDSLAIIKAFCMAFEDCSLWNGIGLDFMLVGVKDGIDSISASEFRDTWQSEIGSELRTIGIEKPAMLGTTFMADSSLLKEVTERVDPVTDNYPHRISPSIEGMQSHSEIYAGLLDIERRKRSYVNSKYIKALFPQEVIEETLQNFDNEDLLTGIFAPKYRNKSIFYWERLTSILLDTDLVTFPLLLLSSTPREEFLVTQIERNPGDKAIGSKEYQLLYIKHLIVSRDYQQAVDLFERYREQFGAEDDPAIDKRIYQLLLLTKALAGNFTAKDLKHLAEPAGALLDKAYVEWFIQRFPDSGLSQ